MPSDYFAAITINQLFEQAGVALLFRDEKFKRLMIRRVIGRLFLRLREKEISVRRFRRVGNATTKARARPLSSDRAERDVPFRFGPGFWSCVR